VGLRERKKVATRAALSWEAIRLIVDRGYDKVLVEDIAEAAGVSPRTFNNYFSSKAEAVASRHLDRCLAIAGILPDRPADEPLWTAITAAVLTQFVPGPEVKAHPRPDRHAWAAGLGLMLAVPAVQAETLRAAAVAEVAVAAAVAERTGTDPAADIYPQLVAAAVMAAITVVSRQYVQSDGRAAVDGLLIDALRQIAAGLPPPAPASERTEGVRGHGL
jgi:AcrR family transcriptional regulator